MGRMYDMIMLRKLIKNLLQHGLGYNMIGMSVHPPCGPHSQTISQSSGIFSSIELLVLYNVKSHSPLICAFCDHPTEKYNFSINCYPTFYEIEFWTPLFKLGYGLCTNANMYLYIKKLEKIRNWYLYISSLLNVHKVKNTSYRNIRMKYSISVKTHKTLILNVQLSIFK